MSLPPSSTRKACSSPPATAKAFDQPIDRFAAAFELDERLEKCRTFLRQSARHPLRDARRKLRVRRCRCFLGRASQAVDGVQDGLDIRMGGEEKGHGFGVFGANALEKLHAGHRRELLVSQDDVDRVLTQDLKTDLRMAGSQDSVLAAQ